MACLNTGVKSQMTEESRLPFLSILLLFPITSMKYTFLAPVGGLAVCTAWSIPNEAPSPMPNTMSAPAPMTLAVTRLPPAASE